MTDKMTETQIYLEIFIPESASKVMDSLSDFIKNNDAKEETIKSFIDFHKAVKAALTNLESLLKLSKLLEESNQITTNVGDDIKAKIKQAELNIVRDLTKSSPKGTN